MPRSAKVALRPVMLLNLVDIRGDAMGKMNRRDFMTSSTQYLMGAVGMLYYPSMLDMRSLGRKLNPQLRGLGCITTGGGAAWTLGSPNPISCDQNSLVTILDLSSGRYLQGLAPISNVHTTWSSPYGEIILNSAHQSTSLVIDNNMKTVAHLILPENYYFGGHSVVLPEKNIYIMTVKRSMSNHPTDHSFLYIYDLKTHKLLNKIETPSTFAHDIIEFGENKVAVSHYGTLRFDLKDWDRPIDKGEVEYLLDVRNPKVSIVDYTKGQVLRNIDYPATHSLNHLTTLNQKDIYTVSIQAIKKDQRSRDYLKRNYNDDWCDTKSVDSTKYVFLPSPIMKYSEATQTFKKFESKNARQQRRSQDIEADPYHGFVYGAFTDGNHLGILKGDDDFRLVDASKFKLKQIRGINILEKTGLIALNDGYFGVSVVDPVKEELVEFFPIRLKRAIHMNYDVHRALKV